MGDYKESWGVVTGTLLPFMGNNAPNGYLICDGTEYNIADYERLADHFEAEFGTKNHFGGDGTTTFKVPDLRGEFLRGTGTNSHENQGSGANVGVHQDGTRFPQIGNYNNSTVYISVGPSGESIGQTADSEITYPSSGARRYKDVGISTDNNSNPFLVTSRPTNTSVLYIIKT